MNDGNEDRRIKSDNSPLMEAAIAGHVDIVNLLINHGAEINAQSTSGNTPLMYGCAGGHVKVVEALLNAGANVEDHNENGHTPLMEAASAGHVPVAEILLKFGAGINTHSNEFKESALTLACYKGHLKMVKFLLDAGADQEHKTDEMHTALMEASMDGHVEVARLLLDSGAQVNMPTDSFESPLTLAACGGHVDLALLLIERGANIEEVNDEGYTPLMEASREGHEEMVALLLSQGANINAQTEETQETALTLACCGGFLEVVDFLVKAGADIELGASTPLMEASQEGHLDIVRYLLELNANVHAQTQTGDTALTYACENGHTDVAELLLGYGADLEHESEGGRTPLMKACRAGHLCTVQFLVNQHANVNRQTTSNDHTSLSLACAGGHLSVVELLLSEAANPSHRLKDNSTMLIEAAKGGHTNVVKLLLDYPHSIMIPSEQNGTSTKIQKTLNSQEFYDNPEDKQPSPPLQYQLSEPIFLSSCTNSVTNENQDIYFMEEQSNHSFLCNDHSANTMESSFDETKTHDDKYLSELFDANTRMIHTVRKNITELKLSSKQEQIFSDSEEKDILMNNGLKKTADEIPRRKPLSLDKTEMMHSVSEHDYNADLKYSENYSPNSRDSEIQRSPIEYYNEYKAKEAYLKGLQEGLRVGKQRILNEANLQEDISHSTQTSLVENVFPSNQCHARLCSTDIPEEHRMKIKTRNDVKLAQKNVHEMVIDKLQQQHLSLMSGLSSDDFRKFLERTQPHCVQQVHQLKILNQQLQIQLEQTQKNTPDSHSKNIQCEASCSFLQTMHNDNKDIQISLEKAINMFESIHFEKADSGILSTAERIVDNKFYENETLPVPSCTKYDQIFDLDDKIISNYSMSEQPSVSTNCNLSFESCYKTPRTQKDSELTTDNYVNEATPDEKIVQYHATKDQIACENQTITPIQTMPLNSIEVDSVTDSNHDTALTLACAGGHEELVGLLLNRGADIEHRDKKGFTPLILAATAGHQKVVEILLNHGADLEAQSERTKDTSLSLACSGGRYEVVDILLNKGANKEHRNVSDYTPLSLAASGGYVNIIKLLLSHGAEINSRTGSKLGISPLMLAAMNGHTSAVKLLLDMGSDINAQIETNRNTALTLACFQGRHEVVSLLLDRKANIEHRAKTGLTPLMEAASGGYIEVGKVLISKGADVNATPVPSSRDTALTIAADKGHNRFVELLLQSNALVEVKNKKGNSPLWLAAHGGHLSVIDVLFHAGADIDSQDQRKVSCLMAAFRKGHVKIVKWMVNHVSQFPSDQEMTRYISTINDKELLGKCHDCVKIIRAAKETQAAKANKNATILLEELDMEKTREESKKAAAARKRERKKKKKLEKNIERQKLKNEVFGGVINEDKSSAENKVKCADKNDFNIVRSTEELKTTIMKNSNDEITENFDKKNTSQVLSNQETNEELEPLPSSIPAFSKLKKKRMSNTTVPMTTQKDNSNVSYIRNPANRDDFEATGNDFSTSKSDVNNSFEFDSALDDGFDVTNNLQNINQSNDGWREVVRKGQTEDSGKHLSSTVRVKKVSVPPVAISRVIGRGGNNINTIRNSTGACIEIDKQSKICGERTITIKGDSHSLKQAYDLVTLLVNNQDMDLPATVSKSKSHGCMAPTANEKNVIASTMVKSSTDIKFKFYQSVCHIYSHVVMVSDFNVDMRATIQEYHTTELRSHIEQCFLDLIPSEPTSHDCEAGPCSERKVKE
ncbi:hypothetical protein TKK_0018900 [Trichogramma kaykai]|uniref:K Homology domain-containing protein n=1 Tax=Trichogramma kaykai TaxID=54128 RepID=A0ABD2VW40_9HYME